MELIAKSNSMSTAELSQMKAELKLKQKVKSALIFVSVVFISCFLCLCSISVTSCLNHDFLICLQKQLTQFDAETQEKVAQAELDALPSLEVKHAHARLELREKQLQELAGTMNELSTEEVSYCLFILLCLVA